MTDDIVARLRVLNHHAKKLAENESLHDLYRDAFTRCEDLTWQAADEIKQLRARVAELERFAGELDASGRENTEPAALRGTPSDGEASASEGYLNTGESVQAETTDR